MFESAWKENKTQALSVCINI